MNVVVNSNYILTPYYDGIIKDTSRAFWYEYQTKNYIPYDFFVLKTRLTYYVDKGLNIHFDSFRYEGQMLYCVLLSNGVTIVPIDFTKSNYYQNIVNTIMIDYPRHCTLLHMNQTFLTNNFFKPLSNRWVTTVLPYCYQHFIDNMYQPILYNNQLLINIDPTQHLNDALINVNDVDDYYKDFNNVYDVLQTKIINDLYQLYKKGVIVLNQDLDNHFIQDLKLKPLYHDGETQIYVANWTDENVIDKTAFLEEQLRQMIS